MSAIEVVTPTHAAASPTHPDHARWVKEQMLAREVSWLRGLGVQVSSTLSEARINEGMRRLEARKRDAKPAPAVPVKQPEREPNENAAHALAREHGYTFRQTHVGRIRDKALAAARQLAGASEEWECGRCGSCVRCKRELRAQNILRMGRAGDSALHPLALRLLSAGLAAQAKVGIFAGHNPHDVNRILTRLVEDVCDQSTAIAGPWR